MWEQRIDTIRKMRDDGSTISQIAEYFKVSNVRISQVIHKYNLPRPSSRRRIEETAKERWLRLRLNRKIDITKEEKDKIKETLELPDQCPVLGFDLNYEGRDGQPKHNFPSIDRTNPSLGYTADNVKVMSYRANTLKSDATAEELRKVIKYIESC